MFDSLLFDFAIVVGYFVLIITVGLYMGRKEHSLKDFALGGRNIPWWAVAASVIATETSVATFLGVPSQGYTHNGIIYAQLVIGLILGRILVGYVFLKPYYDLKVYTVYDFLAVRFGDTSKNYISFLFLFMRTLASGTRLFAPALVMVVAYHFLMSGGERVSVSGNKEDFIPYVWCIIGIVLLTMVYTALGGIKAVIWTDVIQATVMAGSAIVAIWYILYRIGESWNPIVGLNHMFDVVPKMRTHEGYFMFGWEDSQVKSYVAAQAALNQPVQEMNAWHYFRMFVASPFTLMSATVGAILGNIAAFGTDQDMVQRLLTAESHKKARRSLITAAVADLPIAAAFAFIGVLLLAFYRSSGESVVDADVFSHFIIHEMPIGIRGIVLAGVFATAMGSLSSALNALATSATNDWYIPYAARHSSDAHHVAAARFFTFLFAVLLILVAAATAYAKVVNPDFALIPVVIGVAGLFLGPMLGIFLLGMFTRRRGSEFGNVLAVTIALIVTPFLTGNHIEIANMILAMNSENQGIKYILPSWWFQFAWSNNVMVGGLITLAIALMFKTPAAAVERYRQRRAEAHAEEMEEEALARRNKGLI